VIIAENIPNLDSRPWIERSKTINHLNCIFISRIETKKNLHYFLELLKRTDVSSRINFDIYGEEEDGNYTRRCKEIAGSLGPHIQIRFLGPLPHREIFDTLRRYQLFILPTLGENFGHAIFEALSTGCPVLISDQTPWLNLASQKLGWDIPLSDPDKFLDALKQAIHFDQAEFNVWSRNAYQYAIDFFNRLDIKTEYLKLFS
jgi:glycosyltransferase involved in cell wall biosynthesis